MVYKLLGTWYVICEHTHTQAYITCLLLVYISIVNFNKDIPRAVDKVV